MITTETIPGLAAQLVDLLVAAGESWTLTPHAHRHDAQVMRGPVGEELIIEPARDPRRLHIYGSFWPGGADLYRHRHHNAPACSITVAADRPPPAVAAEVRRRLLPAYRAELAAARGRKAEHDEREATIATLARELAALVGDTPCPDQPDRFFGGYSRRYSLRGQVGWDGQVKLDLASLTPAEARHILAFLHAPE